MLTLLKVFPIRVLFEKKITPFQTFQTTQTLERKPNNHSQFFKKFSTPIHEIFKIDKEFETSKLEGRPNPKPLQSLTPNHRKKLEN